jgi:hypothetical protein
MSAAEGAPGPSPEELRALVVVLAQQYKRAVQEWETMQDLARSEAWAQCEMERCAQRVEVEQYALFVALEELQVLEEADGP